MPNWTDCDLRTHSAHGRFTCEPCRTRSACETPSDDPHGKSTMVVAASELDLVVGADGRLDRGPNNRSYRRGGSRASADRRRGGEEAIRTTATSASWPLANSGKTPPRCHKVRVARYPRLALIARGRVVTFSSPRAPRADNLPVADVRRPCRQGSRCPRLPLCGPL